MSEEAQVASGIAEVLDRQGEDRYQWGQYVERKDGDDWTPLIYDGDEETARMWHAQDIESNTYGTFTRRSCVVRRAIGPWEVQPDTA